MYKFLTFLLLTAYVQSRTLPRAPIATKAECSNFQPAERFDCHPEDNANQEACEARGCCWVTKKETDIDTKLPAPGVPTCYYPRNYGGYEWINITEVDNGVVAYLQRTFQSAYPRDVQTLRLDVEYQTNDRVRVKISDAVNKRWESIYPKNPSRYMKAADNPNYDVVVDIQHLGFIVRRKDGTELFNSQDLGALIFADQFLQISGRFNGDIFGIGEERTTFNLNKDWTRFTIFNAGQPPANGINLYGAHPFYMVVEPDGRSHGVFLLNSNAMDVLIQPLDAITFKTIGGILDFYFFMGPTPADVVKQYIEIIGKPIFPPYWGMGFQLCKYGYGSADNTRAVWQRNRDAGIPFDVQWNDIDALQNQNDFTYDHDNFANLPELINDIHEAGMYWVPIVDAGVSAGEPPGTHPPFDDGVTMDTFLKDKDGNILIAKVWNPVATAFPDFTHPNSTAYWTKQLKQYHDQVPFDAIWIDMNEPSNFYNGGPDGCPDDELENPPYLPNVVGGSLYFQTVCMTSKHYAGDHYNIHNLHAAGEAEATQTALVEILGKRSFVISRASSFGAGLYTGHWSGDIFSTWDDLAMSISNMFQYNIFGMPFSGADICGFNWDTNPALCNRWFQVGAFYPFARNHNGLGQLDQDPASFEQDVIDSIRKALTVRYTLLPYLYTLLYRSHVYGETVFRPLFFEFLDDRNTLTVESSFLWGAGIYVVPVLEENAVTVTGYFPKARWYDWYTGEELRGNGENVELDAPFDKVPVFIRGGYVIPTQAPSVTTKQSRKNGFTFIIALDNNNSATGNLFWDDGESLDSVSGNKHGLLEFTASDNKFTSSVQRWETDDTPQLESIKLLGVNIEVNEVTVNGQSAEISREPNNVINIVGLNIPLNTDLEVEWR